METFSQNKKAHFNYELQKTMDAGIELLGFEVKAIRAGHASLEGSHVTIRGGEAFLTGSTISPYQPANTPADYEPGRIRRLLLTKEEIEELAGAENQKGLTIVPISLYNKHGRIKLKIAVARGKKKFDKRETLKKRESDRDVARTLKSSTAD